MNEKSFHLDYLPDNVVKLFENLFFQKGLVYAVLFFIGLVSGLKISIAAFLCIATLLLSLFCTLISRHSDSLALIIISLFLIVNYETTNTPSIIRYLIYIVSGLTLILNNRLIFIKKNLTLLTLLIFSILVATVYSSFQHYIEFKVQPFFRDLFVLFVLFIFCLLSKDIKVNLQLIFILLIGALFGEILYLATNEIVGYLNYSSVKTFILFIPYYLFIKGKNYYALFSLFLCLIVISNYGTRMILLSLIFFSFVGLIIFLLKKGSFRSIVFASIFTLFSFFSLQYILSYEFIQGLKSVAFLGEFYDPKSTSIYEIFKILDPVRYAEHQIFFSRSWTEILFGNGLGAGIIDVKGYLGFVNYYQSAFSQEEINANIYFNLHDYWIDYGLRFGLIPALAIIFFMAIKPMIEGDIFTGIFNGVMLICMTYSGAGILIVALLNRFHKHSFDHQ